VLPGAARGPAGCPGAYIDIVIERVVWADRLNFVNIKARAQKSPFPRNPKFSRVWHVYQKALLSVREKNPGISKVPLGKFK